MSTTTRFKVTVTCTVLADSQEEAERFARDIAGRSMSGEPLAVDWRAGARLLTAPTLDEPVKGSS